MGCDWGMSIMYRKVKDAVKVRDFSVFFMGMMEVCDMIIVELKMVFVW